MEPGFTGMRSGGRETEPLGGWAVGAQPHFWPDGLAQPVKKGSDLVVQYHFHPTGKPEVEKSVIGLYFAKQPPARTLVAIQLPPTYSLFSGLDIPAGEKDFAIRDSWTLPVAFDAVKDWDFSWQDRYFFEQSIPLPKGTRLDAEVHWDNSAGNPGNPSNPPIEVKWGEQSKDEMGSVSLVGVPHEQADFAVLRRDLVKHRNEMARTRLLTDSGLRAKVRELLAQ